MAQAKPRPVIQLTDEQKRRLKEAEADIERAEHGISVLKELGVDTTELEGKIEWAKKAREVMLREFD